PGLGQVLNGRAERAAVFFSAWILLLPVSLRLLLTLPTPLNLVSRLPLKIVTLFSALDAALDDPSKSKPSRPSSALVAALGLTMLAISFGWIWLVRELDAQAVKTPTSSMAPTLLTGDHFVVDRAAYGIRNPFSGIWLWRRRAARRGDLALFLFPED